jgi:ferredoxin
MLGEWLVVDPHLCNRCGLCWLIAPEAFSSQHLERPVKPDAASLLAMEECPTGAIVWQVGMVPEISAIHPDGIQRLATSETSADEHQESSTFM